MTVPIVNIDRIITTICRDISFFAKKLKISPPPQHHKECDIAWIVKNVLATIATSVSQLIST